MPGTAVEDKSCYAMPRGGHRKRSDVKFYNLAKTDPLARLIPFPWRDLSPGKIDP